MAEKRWLKLLLFSFLGIVLVGILVSVGYQRKTQTTPILCVKSDTGEKMEFLEAEEIALESECVEEGNLADEYFCNESTGTWWIDLDIQREGCAPACVINISTKKAEINWRCTGLITP